MLKIKKYEKGGGTTQNHTGINDNVQQSNSSGATTSPWALKNYKGLMMGASAFNSMLGTPRDYEGAAGSTAMGIDGFTDAASQVASQFGPVGLYIGMGLQANKLLSNITGKITGLDGMTSTDVIMNRIPVLGLVNGLGGKRADTMQQDLYTQSQSQFGYNGTNMDINNAAMKSGKKYGMFSSGARRNANWEIASAGRKLNTLKYLIKGRDTAMDAMAGSVDLYNTGYANELMGGYEPLIAAKKGAKLSVAKRVASKHKFTKAQLKKAADTQDDVDAYKNGGTFEFDISIFLKKEELEEEQSVESLKQGGSLIPEGALHKNLNHLGEVNPDLKGEVTKKGIPIISNEEGGEIVQHAEIEEGEIIFQKSVTEKLEELYKEYNKEDISQSKKDELAIKAGKIIAKEIMEKTDDKVGLIEKT